MLDGLDMTSLRSVADILCDGGTLTRALLQRTTEQTRVYAVDSSSALATVAAPSLRVTRLTATGSRVPLDDAACDAVASLLTLGFAAWLPREVVRILRPGGTLRVLTWDAQEPPAHEAALQAALRQVTGSTSHFIDQVLAAPSLGVVSERIRDVVRFDGFAHYWAALVHDRPLGSDMDQLSRASVRAIQARCRAALSAFTAADGSLRIPVTAMLQRSE